MASVITNNSTVGITDFPIKGEEKNLFCHAKLTKTVHQRKNATIPSPKGWFSTPARVTSGGTHALQNLPSGWLHARSYDAKV